MLRGAMSTPQDGRPPMPPSPPPPAPPMAGTPNAEKYVLEADVMRRRQLRSALLHGSRRTWREHRRVWPAVVAGIIATAVVVAAIAVIGAYQQQKKNQEEEENQSGPRIVIPLRTNSDDECSGVYVVCRDTGDISGHLFGQIGRTA